MSAKKGEIWKKLGRCLMGLVLEMTADSYNPGDFWQCMGLIKVTWERLKVCLRFNMWKKKAFRSSFNLIDRMCS